MMQDKRQARKKQKTKKRVGERWKDRKGRD